MTTTRHHWLCCFNSFIIMCTYSADLLYTIFNVLHLVFLGNKLSLLFTNTHPFAFIATATATANPPMQNNKPVKALFTRDVRKIQYSGWGLVQIQHSALPHAVFATRPHPSYCIFRTSLATVFLTYA